MKRPGHSLKKLPPLQVDVQDKQDFLIRGSTPPPPIAGATLAESFPPLEKRQPPPPSAPAPLEVLRFSPEGDVPLAANLSITFSQPMVPLGSQEDAVERNVPVKITPQVPGKWRWAGTQTLLFEPAPRFPMATEFKVEVPAGTKSTTGGTLSAQKTWRFKTPSLQVLKNYPGVGPQDRDPVMVVAFDQKIDPAAVIKSIRVTSGKTAWKVRLANEEELKTDAGASQLAGSLEKGRWLALRIADRKKPFPFDSTISISVDQGAPSAEGPLRTTKPQEFLFKTYGAFQVTNQECGKGTEACTPFTPFVITFNNSVDENAFDAAQVSIEPEIPQMKLEVNNKQLRINGSKRANTDYKVTLKASIRDSFKQNLGSETQLSFRVGVSPARLFSSDFGLVVLDPYAGPRLSVYSLNHTHLKVHLNSVGPEHWADYANGYRTRYLYGGVSGLPGHPVFSETIAVKDQPEQLVETSIDLSPALRDGLGHVLVSVEAMEPPTGRENEKVLTWVEVTNIGLDAFPAGSELLGRATSLKDGKPIEGVKIALLGEGSIASTTRDGLAKLPFESSRKPGPGWVLTARRGSDMALLPESSLWSLMQRLTAIRERKLHLDFTSTSKMLYCSDDLQRGKETLRWFVFDDRGIYRPGEEVHVKGWLRMIGCGATGDVERLGDQVRTVTYTLEDRGTKILAGTCQVDSSGGFDLVLKLPTEMNLGMAYLGLSAVGFECPQKHECSYNHFIQVEEFRRPEFEVSTSASQGTSFVEDHAEVTATASYFAGGTLANADVSWKVTSTPTSFTPPNRSDFSFGRWASWWRSPPHYSDEKSQKFHGKTGGTGKHSLRLDFISDNSPVPTSVTAQATIEDVNRQEWSASSTILVHPADLYVGLKSPRSFVRKGQPIIVQCIVTDLDGKAVPSRDVRVSAVRTFNSYEKGQWVEKETDRQECTVRSASNPVECRFEPKEGSRYRVTATVEDDRRRKNQGEISVVVAGVATAPERDLKKEEVTIIPDKKEYQPGETAELLVQAPFYPAEGLLTLRRGGLVTAELVRIDDSSTVIKVPIRDGYVPNLYAQVDLAGVAVRADEAGKPDDRLPKRPAYASGYCKLSIPPLSRKLDVRATPRSKTMEPGGKTTVDVEVRDSHGKPVAGSEVALIAVDEAVLSLVDHKIDDPLEIFYPERYPGVKDYYMRAVLSLADPRVFIPGEKTGTPDSRAQAFMNLPSRREIEAMIDREESIFKKHMKAGGDGSDSVTVRSDFNPLAVFAPALMTDARGHARMEVKLPDNLTRYRVTAVAVAGGKQFGVGESAITARLPLMVRPSAPRFLNYGDRFELPAIVQNQTENPMKIKVAVKASNSELTRSHGLGITVPANERVEVRFPVATSLAGTARFQLVAQSGKWSDAAEISLPVWTPATTEAFATYGQVDEGMVVQQVQAPSNVFTQFGGLDIETSSTQLQALTDALLYLASYPFECAEQLSSRIIAVAALRNVLTAFNAKGLPAPEEMVAAVDRDIKRLGSYQNSDGGFGLWGHNNNSLPYASIHVVHALQRAKNAGFTVPDEVMKSSEKYLQDIEKYIPVVYGAGARDAIIAYSFYVRNLMGSKDTEKAKNLIKKSGLEGLSMESIGWLLSVLNGDTGSNGEIEAIRKHLQNHVTEEAGTAHFVTSYGDSDYLLMNSDRRADGVILDALITDQPKSDLIPKIVRGLLSHRKRGRWGNTQENAFVLIALDKYFSTYESLPPDFKAQAWIGDAFAGSREFKGYSTERHQIHVPMQFFADTPGPMNLLLQKEGAGRLYYRLGMQYAPSNLKLDPADHGFKVERTYEAVDKDDDVRREQDGSWHIKEGAKVRVRLKLSASARRYFVALVDHLPAGFEPLNPALSTTAAIPEDTGGTKTGHYRFDHWFDHQNLRDERVEAFSELLWAGIYDYSYVARATTPGEFTAPPPKAEEMYHPETFGRGATDRVIVGSRKTN